MSYFQTKFKLGKLYGSWGRHQWRYRYMSEWRRLWCKSYLPLYYKNLKKLLLTSQNKNIFGQLFAEGGCIYDGNILEDFEEINNVGTCQTACQITINAYYYTYEPLFKLCIC